MSVISVPVDEAANLVANASDPNIPMYSYEPGQPPLDASGEGYAKIRANASIPQQFPYEEKTTSTTTTTTTEPTTSTNPPPYHPTLSPSGEKYARQQKP